MNNNLNLWNSVDKTNSKFTKPATKGGYSYTSITPVSQYKEATSVFGIQGIGWGIIKGSEKFNHETYGDDAQGKIVLLTYDAWMYFIYDGKRGEVPLHAQEKASYVTKNGKGYLFVDEEARKKVVTNAMTKALSGLGFNADIFMGMFDNIDYREMLDAEFRLKGAEDSKAEKEVMHKEFNEWLNFKCETILKIKFHAAVKKVIDKTRVTLNDKLKVLGASNESIQAARYKLYNAGNMADKAIDAKKESETNEQNQGD
jgi:hypothetical protein